MMWIKDLCFRGLKQELPYCSVEEKREENCDMNIYIHVQR